MQVNKIVEGKYFVVKPLVDRDLKAGLIIATKYTEIPVNVVLTTGNNVYLKDINFKMLRILDSNNMEMIDEYSNCLCFAKEALTDILEAK